ncbi:hypothetical protein [Elizabethkingia anophelis]|nr:hypothetical protein [Elizabethkingia anophelis]MCW2465526.1 hypothetical protein [Elizabethkingia anophelis]MCW2469305.1 hypothetical protein [Elizabethkingia anophelis]MCW2472894.1 hypothetical protein [Elizabethkingia anophelis]
MNRLTPYLFSFICILLVFQKTWVWVEYKINMDWYLENCTNKNKPELHCNGKCQLNQEETRNPNFTWLKIASEFIGLPALEASVSIHKISTVFQQVSHKIQNPLFGFLRLNLRPPVL